MAWIESHQSLANHRKTLALSRLLGIRRPQIIGHLHLLWWWALDNAPDGNLSSIDISDLAMAMDWNGEASTIIGAMIKVGFINQDMTVHSWDEYAGKLLIQRASNAEKQRRHREKQTQLLLSQSCNHDVTVTSPSRNRATVPNSTVPNSTQPNHTKPYTKKNIIKKSYGQFENVFLTAEEFQKLEERFKSHLKEKIEKLSEYKQSSGKKYKDDFATILVWERKENGGNGNGTNQRYIEKRNRLPDRETGYTPGPHYPELEAETTGATT